MYVDPMGRYARDFRCRESEEFKRLTRIEVHKATFVYLKKGGKITTLPPGGELEEMKIWSRDIDDFLLPHIGDELNRLKHGD